MEATVHDPVLGNERVTWGRRFAWDWPTVAAALVYVVAVMVANTFADDFYDFPVFGVLAWGTLVFGVTFTQRDRVHRAGRPAVYAMIAVTAVCSFLQSVYLDVSWRIIGASLLAIVIAEVVDTEVFHRLRRRSWYARVMLSNAVSVPLDTIIFTTVAFAGVLATDFLVEIIATETVVKWIIGVVVAARIGRRR